MLVMGSLSSEDESDGEDNEWTKELQSFRADIVRSVDYIKLAPALQSAFIFDREDDELIRNPHQNPTSIARANAMVDYLLRRGKDNYEKFLQVMGGYYPKIFTKITNRDPPPAPEYHPVDDFSGEVLSFIFAKLSEKKQECANLVKENVTMRLQMKDNLMELDRLNEAMKEYKSKQERYDRLENDMGELKQVAEHMKSENYTICMRLVNTNEKNSKLREQNMLLRLENDKSVAELRKLENRIHSERSQSVRLRHQLDTVPTEREVNVLQKEIEQLKIKVAQSHEKDVATCHQVDADTRVEILRNDLRDAVELYGEASQKLNKLREELDEVQNLKDKYLQENERLHLQCTAVTDDCEMYKSRRDAVWEQLQEVEKERDQLVKERNEAQLSGQAYMEEKTKYRYKIHQLEEIQDKLSQKLREKDNLIKKLREEAEDVTTFTSALDLIQDLPSDVEQRSPSDSISAASTESLSASGCRTRITSRRCAIKSVKPHEQEKKERSLTNLIRESVFRKLVEADGRIHDVNMIMKSIQTMVEFTGGNETGIFIGKVEKSSYAEVIGLAPGMKLLKVPGISMALQNAPPVKLKQKVFPTFRESIQTGFIRIAMNEKHARELHLRNCTLENVINIFQEIGDSMAISIQYNEEEYERLQERTSDGKCSGDSFYVRANFTLKKEGYLSFDKGSVLHVVHTRPDKSKDWLAHIVDMNTGEDTNKSGIIPSYRNCISNSQLQRSFQLLSRPLSSVDFSKIFRTMPGSQDFCPSLAAEDISNGLKCSPYTVVKKAPAQKVEYRPCFFVPRTLCTVLSFKLTTITEPFQFDLPVPASMKCSEEKALRRVVTSEAISCKMISPEMHEFVTVDAVRKITRQKKHCILPYNDKCMSVENFIMMLHMKDIYPIVFYISGEKERGLKLLLQQEQKDVQPVLQDIKRDLLMLDKHVPQYATINLDRCNRLEDAVQQVMDHITVETNKVIWISGKSDVQI